jgi:diguanylate cyclase (GGDEF)-like protein/PAS domain S-box-containing protein
MHLQATESTKLNGTSRADMREVNMNKGSEALARKAILAGGVVALAGSAVGVFGTLSGTIAGAQTVLIPACGVFNLLLLLTLLFYRKIAVQTAASASTVFYILYLTAGLVISIVGEADHHSFFVYLVWFFPLMVFNKLVNSPAVGRIFEKIVLVDPLVVVGYLFVSNWGATFAVATLTVAGAACLAYACFSLLLSAATRYREKYIVEQERAEPLRIESEVLESISDCFISFDSEFRLVYMNDAACLEFGVERRAALGRTIQEAIPGFFSQSMLGQLQMASGNASMIVFEAEDEKQRQWYEMRCFPRLRRMSVYFRNTTETVLSRRRLEAAHNRVREQSQFLDKAQDAIFVQDMESRVLYWNKGAERLFGWTPAEVMGRRVGDIFHQTRADVTRAFDSIVQQGEWKGELSKRHKDGRTFIVESRCTLLRDEDGNPKSILAINTDITDRKAADARIHRLAFYDVLTGLPNRVLLRERLEAALANGAHPRFTGALMLVDLDDFKTLNDTAGHDVGDLLLRAVAARLTSCVRKGDTVARLGGDEFMVMLEGLSMDAGGASGETRLIGEKILRACREPYSLGNYEYDGTASIGGTRFSGNGESVDDLLRQADLAMYQAKALNRNTMCCFDPAMETSAASRAALLADLKRAMQNREFELYYQPQMDSQGRMGGAEALLRWPHAQRGMVPPNEFIPLAEAAGLIVDLGYWVLETACLQIAEWAKNPQTEGLNIAVNVSLRQFADSRFVQLVEKVLRESGANPHRLKLEITESFMMDKGNDAVAKMTALKAQGVGFSMDDFGTGYSSLSQLKRLPLDQLKIDQSFVRDVLNGAKDAAIVRTIITLGRSLNLAVIAEGVETEEQRDFLERLGCFAYQGYLYSPALPTPQFEAYVAATCRLNEEGAA